MKNFFKYSFIIIINYVLITAIVFVFSFISLKNNIVYDSIWIKSIQNKLYHSGLRNIWQTSKNCAKFDSNLLYSPVIGKCKFSNPEFSTELNFDINGRIHSEKRTIQNTEKLIAVLGDSVAMGWGVNDHETFAYHLEKKIKKKVLNLGVASYGTIREIKRLKLNNYYNQVETIIIQYHLNDIYENQKLSFEKKYSLDEYESEFKLNKFNYLKFVLRHFKKSFRLLFQDIKNKIFKAQDVQPHDFKIHLQLLNKIINAQFKDEEKKIIVLFIKEPKQKIINFDKNLIKNFNYLIIEMKKNDYFIIDDHPNKKGHLKIAKKLIKYLKN